MRLAPLLRATGRGLAWLLTALVVLVLLWFVANRLLDEPVAPKRAAMLGTTSPVADRQNAAVGILGLTAPRDTDFVEFGAQVKALYAHDASHAQIREMIHGPKTLQPTVENSQVTCWLDPDWTFIDGCLPFDQAPAVLDANRELLDRFKKLYGFEHYVPVDVYHSDAYLLLTKLAVAEMQLSLRRGDPESAYTMWHRQLRFARRNLRGDDTWVGKAIGLVAVGFSISLLESMLIANPGIAKTHAAELYGVLLPDGDSAVDGDRIARGELRLLANAFERPPGEIPGYGIDRVHWLAYYLGQKNRTLNRAAAFAQDYAASLRGPWADMEKESARLREKYFEPRTRDVLVDPFGSVLLAQYIDSDLRIGEIRRQMRIYDGRFRLATLLVRIVNDGVRDADIPGLLTSASPTLRDPFSGAAPRWDPNDRKIYFVDPIDHCIITSWFRVPDKKRVRKSSSVVNTNAC